MTLTSIHTLVSSRPFEGGMDPVDLILTCVSSMDGEGHQKLLLWDNLEGWGGGKKEGFMMVGPCIATANSC